MTAREDQVKFYYRHRENYDWTRTASSLVGLETLFHRSRLKETLKLVAEFGPPGRYLDVGCGTAMVTRFLPPGTVGLDLNPRNLEKARRYAPSSHLVLCDAEGAIPLANATFDAAVCTEMLEHLLQPGLALAELGRLLKPTGILIGSVPGESPIWKLRGLSSSRGCFVAEPYHKHYSRAALMELLSQAFDVRKLYSRNWEMNWFFVCRQRLDTEASPAWPRG